MRKIAANEFVKIFNLHKKWLNGEEGGVQADLHNCDLRWCDLRHCNLSGCDLSCSDLSWCDLRWCDLSGCNLYEADLRHCNLTGCNLYEADLRNCDLTCSDLSWCDLRGCNLKWCDLYGADLRGCDLSGCDIDFSCLPLWCGSLSAHFDDHQLIQIAYHLVKAGLQSKNASDETKAELSKLIDFANQFHRVVECGKIENLKREG